MLLTAKIKVQDGARPAIREHLAAALEANDCELKSISFPGTSQTGRKKGMAWERAFAKSLSEWWTGGSDSYVFERRASSGGSHRDRSGLSGHAGDIVAAKHSGEPFTARICMELKNYKDLTRDLWGFLTGDPSARFLDFWEQALEQAAPYKRKAWLVMTTNGLPPLVVSNWGPLDLVEHIPSHVRQLGPHQVWLFAWQDFVREFSPEEVLVAMGPVNQQSKRFSRRKEQ